MNKEVAQKIKGLFLEFYLSKGENREKVKIAILAYTEACCDMALSNK